MKRYFTIQPPPDLQPVIRSMWTFDDETRPEEKKVFRVMSDGLPGLVFHQHEGRPAFLNAAGQPLPQTFVYGQLTQPCTNYALFGYRAAGILFEPIALGALFGAGGESMTNRLAGLNDLTKDNITDRLANTADPQSRLSLLVSFFRKRLERASPSDAMIIDSIHTLRREHPTITIAELRERHRVSERQFERRFQNAVGVTPHQYLRIRRFQYTLSTLQRGSNRNLAALAYDAGYADQSHFIRDFKQFSGFKPKEYARLHPADPLRSSRIVILPE